MSALIAISTILGRCRFVKRLNPQNRSGADMNKNVLLLVLALILFSCAHGKTDSFPQTGSSTESAEVVVIRSDELVGWGFSQKLILDGNVIAGLRAGEYVTFFVTPGFHTLGVGEDSITMPFRQGQTHYFLIRVSYSSFGFDFSRIDKQRAAYWMARAKPLG